MGLTRLRFWLLLSGTLVVLAAVTSGLTIGLWVGKSSVPVISEPSLLLPEYSSYWLLRSRDVWDELGVADEQRKQLDAVLAEHYSADLELRARLEALALEAQQRIFDLLTPEQQEQFAEILKRYSEDRIEDETIRELSMLRREIHLGFDQQPEAYQAVFDFGLETRDIFRRSFGRGREKKDFASVRQELDEARERLFERLERVLSPEQLAMYRQIVEQREKFFRQRRRRPSTDEDRRDRDRGDREREHRSPPPPPPTDSDGSVGSEASLEAPADSVGPEGGPQPPG